MSKKQIMVYLKTSKKRSETLLSINFLESKESNVFVGDVSDRAKNYETFNVKNTFNSGVIWFNPGDGTVDIDPPKK